jgi:hypothetical protein
MAPGDIVNHRRQAHRDRDPNLHAHSLYRNDAVRAGASLTWSLVAGRFLTPEFIAISDASGFFLPLGARMINGARKPVCNANSASALPEGRRQLIGSIHSIGR